MLVEIEMNTQINTDSGVTTKEKIDLLGAFKLFSQGKTLGDALEVTQGTKDSLYSVAVVDYEAKRYLKAIHGLRLLVVLDQNNADYWSLMGNALKDSGMYIEAITAWYMAMGIAPTFRTAMVIARVSIAIKDKEWAAEGLLMALAHLGDNPKEAEDYQKLFELYQQL
jgi:tetratricopeptide (TPR) repeat protein